MPSSFQCLVEKFSDQPAPSRYRLQAIRVVVLAMLLLSAATTSSAQVADFSWDGQINNRWDHLNTTPDESSQTNWNPEALPGGADTVSFAGPNTNTRVDLSGNKIIDTLMFSGSVGYHLENSVLFVASGDITVEGTAAHTIDSDINILRDGLWHVADHSAITVNGSISGAAGLTKTGSGSLTLAAFNTYLGATHIDAGSIVLGRPDALSRTVVWLNVDHGLDLTSNAIDARLGGLTGSGDLNLGSQNLTVTVRDDTLTYSGQLSGTGELIKTDNGVLSLAQDNTHGGTQINEGVLQLDHANRIGGPTAPLTLSGGGLRATANLATTATRPLRLTGVGGSIDTNGHEAVWNGPVDGPGTMVKTGSGPLRLTAANSYTGGTVIEAGAVLVNNTTGSATGSGGVTVRANATLGGLGFAGGNTTVQAGGTIAPGVSTGTLSLQSLVFEPGSVLTIDLTGDGTLTDDAFDRLNISNDVSLNGVLELAIGEGFTPSFGDQFPVLTAGTRANTFAQIQGVVPEGRDFALAPIYDHDGSIGLTLITALPGDADLDGAATLGDLGVILDNLGGEGDWAHGDFNGDHVVALSDLGVILDNLGRSTASVAASPVSAGVPEPTTLSLTIIGLTGVLRRRSGVVRSP